MADENILTWNVTNWVTVILMASVFFGVLAVGQKYWKKRQASQTT